MPAWLMAAARTKLARLGHGLLAVFLVPPSHPERRAEQAYRAIALLLVLFGLVLRFRGYLGEPFSLWLDEAFWANRLMRDPLLKMSIRPIGFMWLSRWLATEFGPTEFWLRLLPMLGSIGTLLLTPYVARRLVRSRVIALLALFTMATHPALVDLAKEFKPYSLETFIHIVPIALYLRHRQTGKLFPLMAALLGLPIALLFAYNAVFLLPGFLLVVGYRTLVTRGVRLAKLWAPLLAMTVCAATCVSILLALRSLTLQKTERPSHIAYWSRKYDVFYPPRGHHKIHDTQVSWTTTKYLDMAAVPGLQRRLWKLPPGLDGSRGDELRAGDRLVWIALHLLALVMLIRRKRFEELLVLWAPLVVMTAFNVAAKWPLGAFRTNLFMVPHAILLASLGVAELASGSRRKWPVLVAASLFFVVPTLAFGFDGAAQKRIWTAHSDFRSMLSRLRSLREEELRKNPDAPRQTIIAETFSAHSYRYYLGRHPEMRAKHRDFFKENFRLVPVWGKPDSLRKRLASALRRSKRPVWVMVSKRRDIEPVLDGAKRVGRVVYEERFADSNLLLRVARKRGKGREK